MTTTYQRGPSDLGRRLAERRRERGLTVEQVAAGASMDPRYLEYLETAPDPDPSRTSLIRLATVLEISSAALSGSGQLVPPGGGPGRPEARLEALGRDECMALIAAGGVGRFVFLEGRGPVAVPVNFRVLDGDIVFRTGRSTAIAARADQQRVSFEVDHLDEALAEGWSVLVSGRARPVQDPTELDGLRRLGVQPWAGGQRDSYYRLRPEDVTGRRIRATSDPAGGRAVR